MPSALGVALLIGVVAFRAGDAPPDPAAALERAMARAETSLRAGRLEAAEAEYQPYLTAGTAGVTVQAFLTQRGGGVVKAAGRTVTLDPATSVGNESWGKAGKIWVH